MLGRLKKITDRFRAELRLYRLVLGDPRTPRLAKWFLGLAVGYALSPIDLIPDFIPVLGHLDDVLIVPLLLILAMKVIPSEVVEDCREEKTNQTNPLADLDIDYRIVNY